MALAAAHSYIGRMRHHPHRELAEERAIGICIEDVPYAVLMATPADVIDLAYGFALTEAIATPGEIESVTSEDTPDGVRLNITRKPQAQRRLPRARSIESRSGCGVCGTSRLRDVMRDLPTVEAALQISSAAIRRALTALEQAQDLGTRTRATHAAGFFDAAGVLLRLREDVGRHNALDKLAGSLLREGVDAGQGFVVITSRCSFEMVEKTARLGAPILVAISAPTSLALERAQASGLTLVATARHDGFEVWTGAERIKEESSFS